MSFDKNALSCIYHCSVEQIHYHPNNVPLCPLGNQGWADCPCSFASARIPYEQEHPTWSSLPLASFTQQNALVCTHNFGRLDRLFPFITELFHVYGQTKVCFFIPLSLKHPCCFQFVPIIKTTALNVVMGSVSRNINAELYLKLFLKLLALSLHIFK